MKFDMHCHTKEGSMDGKVVIEEYICALKKKGFSGMLVSDHNSYDGYREWKNSIKGKAHQDFIVLKGVEYDTCDCGHILVIMPFGVKLKILELRGLPASLLIKIVHAYGGILGPAHPYGEKFMSMITTTMRKEKYKEKITALMPQFDFVEIYNACESEETNAKARKLAEEYNKPGFGGSDAHRLDCIGMAYSEFPETVRSEDDLIAFVKTFYYAWRVVCCSPRNLVGEYDVVDDDEAQPPKKEVSPEERAKQLSLFDPCQLLRQGTWRKFCNSECNYMFAFKQNGKCNLTMIPAVASALVQVAFVVLDWY